MDVFRDSTLPATEHVRATDIILALGSDDPDVLAGREFLRVFDIVKEHGPNAIDALDRAWRDTVDEKGSAAMSGDQLKALANLAVALATLGNGERAWAMLRPNERDPTPSVRVMHELARLRCPPHIIVEHLQKAFELDDPIMISSLCQTLGEMSLETPDTTHQRLVARLCSAYKKHPHHGVHGSIEWLLRQWGYADRLTEMTAELAREQPKPSRALDGRRWYVNGQMQTIVIFTGSSFQMGRGLKNRFPITLAVSTSFWLTAAANS
jgi:hypothetical protein